MERQRRNFMNMASGFESLVISQDPCSEIVYKKLNNWKRSVNYISNSSTGNEDLCDDHLVQRWYRFTSKAGGQMPTSCPRSKACGTMMQLWLKGTHPSISEGVKTMTLCLRTDDGCCKMIKTIKVQKCKRNYKEFYVYELLSADGCPMAYCAGTEVPCPKGSNSKTGFTPGCTEHSALTAEAQVPSKDHQHPTRGSNCEMSETRDITPPKDPDSNQDKQEQRYAVIIGSAVGGIVVLILCILLALMILKKLRPRAYSKRRASVAFTDASHIESKGKSQMDEPKLQTMKFCNKAFVEDTD